MNTIIGKASLAEQLAKLIQDSWIMRWLLPILTVIVIAVSQSLIFLIVPGERVMGAVQRIFYFHVGSALSAYLMIGILFSCSVGYLATHRKEWDLMAAAAAGVALLLCGIVLVTGIIWAHSAWNVWWRWEPRLVSFLVLWLILLSYVIFREFSVNDPRLPNFSAALGILAAVNVPIVIFSVKLLAHSEQAHPQVIAGRGLTEPGYVYGLITSILAVALLSLWLCALKTRILLLQRAIENLERDI